MQQECGSLWCPLAEWHRDGRKMDPWLQSIIRRMKSPFFRATPLVGHSHHPGSPCGPASAGRCIAFGHCCRHGHYLQGGSPESGATASRPHRLPQHELAACGLTGRKATTKEHIKEVFRGDVGFKASVEVPVAMAVPSSLALVVTKLVVLFPFLWVAEYGVCRADGWKG